MRLNLRDTVTHLRPLSLRPSTTTRLVLGPSQPHAPTPPRCRSHRSSHPNPRRVGPEIGTRERLACAGPVTVECGRSRQTARRRPAPAHAHGAQPDVAAAVRPRVPGPLRRAREREARRVVRPAAPAQGVGLVAGRSGAGSVAAVAVVAPAALGMVEARAGAAVLGRRALGRAAVARASGAPAPSEPPGVRVVVSAPSTTTEQSQRR